MKFELTNEKVFQYKCEGKNVSFYMSKHPYGDGSLYYVYMRQGYEHIKMGQFVEASDAGIKTLSKEAEETIKSYIKTITEIKVKLNKAVKEKTECYATQIGVH
jgi:hypothetical protein